MNISDGNYYNTKSYVISYEICFLAYVWYVVSGYFIRTLTMFQLSIDFVHYLLQRIDDILERIMYGFFIAFRFIFYCASKKLSCLHYIVHSHRCEQCCSSSSGISAAYALLALVWTKIAIQFESALIAFMRFYYT